MQRLRSGTVVAVLVALVATFEGRAADVQSDAGWRSLPLIEKGKVADEWKFVGFGRFDVEDGVLRTIPDERGLGLLVYTKEKFGNCQIKVVFRPEQRRSNAGVYVRIDDGILEAKPLTPVDRNDDGELPPAELKKMQAASENEEGPWYAVHHGYEVQIWDGTDSSHRTGSIYSLAASKNAPESEPGAWRTMVITLKGEQILVDVDGKRVTEFDPTSKSVPERKAWHEPKREPKRPQKGYIGLQTHDPGDLVEFKEVSVRPLP